MSLGTASGALKAAGNLPPAVHFVLENLNLYERYLRDIGAGKALINYEHNKKLEPQFSFDGSKMITNQDSDHFSQFRFGNTNLKKVGCEVIAGYNLTKKMGMDIDLAKVSLMYEALGITIGKFVGYLGSNPCQIWYFLDACHIKYDFIKNYKDFRDKVKPDSNYHYIISTWNTTNINDGLHTYYIESSNSSRFTTYNFTSGNYPYSKSIDEICNDSDRFICCYRVEK